MAKLIKNVPLPLEYYIDNVRDHCKKVKEHADKIRRHHKSIEFALVEIKRLYGGDNENVR
jgi:hypothetical protein